MSQKMSVEVAVKGIWRRIRKKYSTEKNNRIKFEELQREDNLAELSGKEGITLSFPEGRRAFAL